MAHLDNQKANKVPKQHIMSTKIASLKWGNISMDIRLMTLMAAAAGPVLAVVALE
jgi:hypothetical protein